jgi:uncharacterized protein (TIGR02996 family)
MSDADAFLAAIIADPDSDVPRLVFADWLEEHGDTERAEFIRLQCSLERDVLSREETLRVTARVNELIGQHKPSWRIPKIPGSQTFQRGFVDQLHISAADLLQYHEVIERTTPIIELRLSAAEQYTNQLAELPILRRLRRLEIRNENIGPRLRDLCRPNVLPELRSLVLRNNRLWSEYVTTLSELAKHLPKLERLDLSGNPMGDEGMQALAGSENLAGLRELVLQSDDVDQLYTIHEPGAAALAKSRTLTQLQALYLGGQNIGDLGCRSLIHSPNFRELKVLDVSQNNLTGVGWIADFVRSSQFGGLRYLNLARNPFDSTVVLNLRELPQLAHGCWVDLHGCPLDETALGILQQCPYATQFRLDGGPTT